MTFNSPQFLVYLPLVLLVYGLVFRRERPRDLFLLAARYMFYMSWNWQYAGLILFSTCVDYCIGLQMSATQDQARRRVLLILSLITNLGVLAIFKYFNFFVDLTVDTASFLGFEMQTIHLQLLLPVGISFYTFQSLSYSIDLYRKEIEVERSFIKFALFVSFFPQLVAGPIVRAATFLPQLNRKPDVSEDNFSSGLLLVFRGLIKKVIVADMLAGLAVDAVFADPGSYSSLTLLLALYGYTFQIYNDFSGYSDIAIGVARMLGFHLPDNFNRPYLSTNVREFWTRWHISLSSWLRDYLYISLGGNRDTAWKVKRNLMITMFLGGLWHGASLNFVAWGVWHGLLLILARGATKHEVKPLPVLIWQRFWCFHLIAFSWLLFRIDNMEHFLEYVNGLMAFTGELQVSPLFILVLAATAASHFIPKDWMDKALAQHTRLPAPVQAGTYAGLVLLLTALTFGGPAFIYFQF